MSLALLVAAAALLGYLAAQQKLGWAWDALQLYAGGSTTSTIEHRLERRAVAILQRGGSMAEARELIERSLAIDPNSTAVHVLGDIYLREGDLDAARVQYERYLSLDPSYLPTYLRLIEVYETLGLTAERTRLLEDGVAYFAANLEAYAPQPDDDVYTVYNDKAYGVYNAYRESLHLLQLQLKGE